MEPNTLGLRGRFYSWLKSLVARSNNKSQSNVATSEEDIARYCEGGYHPVRLGDFFKNGRYKVVGKLGYGSYSTVWLAHDCESSQRVALKILTADTFNHGHDTFELDILHHIKQNAPDHPGASNILHILDEFRHRGPNGNHICLVFKPMGPDMSRYRRLLPRPRVPVPIMKAISRQLLLALSYLHDTCRVIHTDIKPQNILIETASIGRVFGSIPSKSFCPPNNRRHSKDFYLPSMRVSTIEEDIAKATNFSVRLADFGTATWFDNHLTEWIQPDMLRAPEVILEAKWDHKVDIWNLGLIIWELTEGKLAFDGLWTPEDPYTAEAHLAQMKAILGNFPKKLLDRSHKKDTYFDADGHLAKPSTFPDMSLDHITRNSELEGLDRANFLDFIGSMTRLDPEQRPEARELLESPWLS